MHESTNISYGLGNVTATFSSESVSDIPAPAIRAGDFDELITACFTQKELEQIYEGASAEVTFSYVMYDEAPNESVQAGFDKFIEENTVLQRYNRGFYIDCISFKTVGDNPDVEFSSFSKDVELQMEIPLFLRNAEYEYCCILDNMGSCEALYDSDDDTDTLSVTTGSTGCFLLMYKNYSGAANSQKHFHINTQYIFITAIICLLGLWVIVDRAHRRDN